MQGRQNAVMGHREGCREGNKAVVMWLWCMQEGVQGAQGMWTAVMGQREGCREGYKAVVMWLWCIEMVIDRGAGKAESGYGA